MIEKDNILVDGELYVNMEAAKPHIKEDSKVYKYCDITDEWYDIETGLTDSEQKILDNTAETYNLLSTMYQHNPNHLKDATQHINGLRRIIQSRVCHRLYPNVWKVKGR